MCTLSIPAHDFLLLAIEATIDISNMINSGKSEDLKAMQGLAKELEEIIGGSIKYKNALRLNMAVIYILNEAIKKGTGKILTKVDELPDEVAKIVQTLNNPIIKKSNELRKAQDFCLALSRAIMVYRREEFSYRFQF